MNCNQHVNGWSVIARHLAMRAKNQSDLARILQISPAAVTQIKNGQFLLNSGQINAITKFLEFSNAAIDEFYSELFTARLRTSKKRSAVGNAVNLRCEVKMQRHNESRDIPVVNVSKLAEFSPALERIDDFMRRNSARRCSCDIVGAGCAVETEEVDEIQGVKPGWRLILDKEHFPENGEKVLVCRGNGQLLLGEFYKNGRKISFYEAHANGNRNLVWAPHRHPGEVRWIVPVLAELPIVEKVSDQPISEFDLEH